MNHLFLFGLSLIIPFFAINPTSIQVAKNPSLSNAEITDKLQNLPRWKQQEQALIYTHRFNNFIESVSFVSCLVEPAEALGHHPDLAISYNQVTINLTTHDAGGLTDLYFQLAEKINQILQSWSSQKSC
ncbi:MAG: 4a-hydroxytetrahydrobiopterin dehydratase [Microcoleaceae cyanobacterium]